MNIRYDQPLASNRLPRPVAAKRLAKTVAIGPIREANRLAALFRELGWTVITNASGKETRKLAMRAKAQVVVLPCNSSPESGWLSAAKLSKCEPKIRVVLIGLDSGPAEEEFALFAGASAYLAESDGIDAVLSAALGDSVVA